MEDAHIKYEQTVARRMAMQCEFQNYLFKDLVEAKVLTLGNEIEMECLWYCFSSLIQKDLDITKEYWNTHSIRQSHHDTVKGRPDELFYLPELYGG